MKIKQTDVFERWFRRLRDTVAKRRILARLEAIEAADYFGDHKHLDESVSELRFHFGPGYRIYYTIRGETLVLLLAGGDKSSQQSDIVKAMQLAKEV